MYVCMHSFFSAIKSIYGPSIQGTTLLTPKDGGDLIKEWEAVNIRWKERPWEDLLIRNSVVDESVFNSIPQHPVRDDLGNLPTLDEVEQAIKKSKKNRSPGADGIPAKSLSKEEMSYHYRSMLSSQWYATTKILDIRAGEVQSTMPAEDNSNPTRG